MTAPTHTRWGVLAIGWLVVGGIVIVAVCGILSAIQRGN